MSGQTPYEWITYTAPTTGTYHLSIFHFAGTVPTRLQLEAFSGQDLSVPVANNSIGSPAESANAGLLAVGAAYWVTPTTIETFSSRGPTTDGKVKPDIVGADGGDSSTFSPIPFFGTSQASPHVAGMAALVLDQFSALTPAEVATYLKANALGQGTVPNNTWGYGLAKLPSLTPGAPTIGTAVAGDRQATVGWTAPAANGGSAITQYTVTASPGAQIVVVDGSTLQATVTGLINGTSYTFTVTATNAVGDSDSSPASTSVTPINFPPVVTAVADLTADEGQSLTIQVATFADVEPAQLHTATIDWGDGSVSAGTVTEQGGTVSGSHTFGDNGTFAVNVAVTDDAGGSGSDGFTIVVNNVAPVVNAGPDQVQDVGLTSILGASFSDAGASDTHTAVIDWGDGIVEQVTPITGSHQYASTGTYTVTMSVADNDGGVGVDTLVVNIPGITTWSLAVLAVGLTLLTVVYATRRRQV